MDILANVARGSIFGAALTLSGVYLPSVIVGQLRLQDFHMLQAFLTASATSAVILAFSKSANKPKVASHLGLIGPYDGNIIGGAMVGSGMALTGACPGTVFVQVATGVPSAFPVLLGGLAGGTLYVTASKWLRRPQADKQCQAPDASTIPSKLHVDPLSAVLAYDGVLGAVVVVASQIRPQSAKLLNPIIGGFGIGLAQLASVLLTHDAIGMSSSYEDAGKWVVWLTSKLAGQQPAAKPATKSIIFASSVLLGAFLLSRARPELIMSDSMPITPIKGFIGGLVMILGARLAQGCTSGHGISGMASLSIASLYTVAAMFGGGIALALALNL